jgi:arylformamidase
MVDWFNPRQAVPDSEAMMSRFDLASQTFRRWWPHQILDLQYGPDERQRYDVFEPEPSTKSRGTVLFVHGGFWFSRHKDQFSFMAQAYVQAGWTFVAMTYPLMPAVNLTGLVDQTSAGLVAIDRQLLERHGRGIRVAAGHSAGAHLLAMAFHTERGRQQTKAMLHQPERLVLVSGVYDPQARAAAEVSKTIGLTPDDAVANCPLTHCLPSAIPTLLFAGAREPELWQDMGHRYVDHLRRMGLVSAEQHVVAGHDHFSLLEAMANPASEISEAILQPICRLSTT